MNRRLMKGRIFIFGCAYLLLVLAGHSYASETGLIQAVKQGNLKRAEYWLEDGESPNVLLPDYSTLLAWAADSQNFPLVELLLAHGATPDLKGSERNNFSALFIACQRGDDDIVRALLDAGADVSRTTDDGIAPLQACSGYASPASLSVLLQAGANVDAVSDTGQSALMWAAANGQLDNIRYLIERGADINAVSKAGFNALFFAIKSGKAEPAFALIELGANTSQVANDGTTAVQLAMYSKQYALVQHLVERGADVLAYDRNGNQLIHAAIQASNSQLVKTLISKGADVNALTGESKVVWRYEVNFTARPYLSYAKSSLFMAAERGDTQVMQALVDAGADVNFTSEDGNTIVHAAAQSKPDALALAVKLSPRVNVQNKSGETPLHRLLSLGTDKPTTNEDIAIMLNTLAEAGAKVDIENASGNTALAIASSVQHRSKQAFMEVFKVEGAQNL